MAAKNKNFLTNFKKDPKTNKVYFVGNYMEVYVPENYFPTMAEVVGDKINTLGIFLYRIFSNREKKETVKLGVYKFPSILTTKPSDLEKKKLDFNGKVMDYKCLIYYKNDIFIDNTTIIKSASIVNNYIDFYHAGKVPNFVEYSDSVKLVLESIGVNEMKFDVSAVTFEAMASELCRSKDDPSKPFRFALAEGANERDFVFVSIRTIPSYTSTFSSLTFEDIDYQLVSSVNRTKYNKPEIESPIEKIIKC